MLFYDTTDLETDERVLNMQERRDGGRGRRGGGGRDERGGEMRRRQRKKRRSAPPSRPSFFISFFPSFRKCRIFITSLHLAGPSTPLPPHLISFSLSPRPFYPLSPILPPLLKMKRRFPSTPRCRTPVTWPPPSACPRKIMDSRSWFRSF